MGALCSCFKGGYGVTKEDQVELSETKRKAEGHRPRRTKVETEEDRAKAAEAKYKAGLAAQQRAEAFEKSAYGKATRKAVAEAAKPSPPPSQRGEPALKWQMG